MLVFPAAPDLLERNNTHLHIKNALRPRTSSLSGPVTTEILFWLSLS